MKRFVSFPFQAKLKTNASKAAELESGGRGREFILHPETNDILRSADLPADFREREQLTVPPGQFLATSSPQTGPVSEGTL